MSSMVPLSFPKERRQRPPNSSPRTLVEPSGDIEPLGLTKRGEEDQANKENQGDE